MRRVPERGDFGTYVQSFAVYGRNLGVIVPIAAAVLLVVLLTILGTWFFAAVNGAGIPFLGLIGQIALGFAFGVSVIFADDAWRHGRASLGAAWSRARMRAGDILLAVIGLGFLVFAAGLVGGLTQIPYVSEIFRAAAAWAFIYAIPGAAIGGVPGSASFSASLQIAKEHPIGTFILVVISAALYHLSVNYGLGALALYLPHYAFYATQLLLESLVLGYIAIVIAKFYAGFAFRSYR